MLHGIVAVALRQRFVSFQQLLIRLINILMISPLLLSICNHYQGQETICVDQPIDEGLKNGIRDVAFLVSDEFNQYVDALLVFIEDLLPTFRLQVGWIIPIATIERLRQVLDDFVEPLPVLLIADRSAERRDGAENTLLDTERPQHDDRYLGARYATVSVIHGKRHVVRAKGTGERYQCVGC